MKLTERQIRRIIREEIEKTDADEATKTAAGKKTEQLMDSSTMNAFKVALDKATTKDAVKEILEQVFSGLGENGQKFLKLALKELAQQM